MNDVLTGAADLQAFGADEAALERVEQANRQLGTARPPLGHGVGLGVGLASLVAGLTLWGVLVLGVAAVGSGALTRVPLAVLTLTALASFEAVTTLPAAAVQLSHARTAATRIAEVMDASPPVTDPGDPLPLPDLAGGVSVRLRDARVRYRPDGPFAVDGIDLDLTPGRRVALVGPPGAGQVHGRRGPAPLPRSHRRLGHPERASTGRVPRRGRQVGDRRLPAGPAPVQRQHRREHQARQARRPRPRRWPRSSPGSAWPGGSPRCRTAWTPRSGSAARRCLAGSGSGSRWRGRCWPTRRCWSSTSRPRIWTRPAGVSSWPTCSRSPRAASVLLITHDADGLEQVDEIVVLDGGRVAERGTHAGLLAEPRAHTGGCSEPSQRAPGQLGDAPL